jgi:hypothetical protein
MSWLVCRLDCSCLLEILIFRREDEKKAYDLFAMTTPIIYLAPLFWFLRHRVEEVMLNVENDGIFDEGGVGFGEGDVVGSSRWYPVVV